MRQGYGTADVGCIGYECYHKNGLHVANRAYVEICHPDTGIPLKDGEVGEIVVTAFNKTYPLIRLATGDLSFHRPRALRLRTHQPASGQHRRPRGHHRPYQGHVRLPAPG